jgi:hypothetical protein
MSTKEEALEALEIIRDYIDVRPPFMDQADEALLIAGRTIMSTPEAAPEKERQMFIKTPPADTYENLRKQYNALKTFLNTQHHILEYYQNKDYRANESRLAALENALDSEREMNAKLTQELDQIEQTILSRMEQQDKK